MYSFMQYKICPYGTVLDERDMTTSDENLYQFWLQKFKQTQLKALMFSSAIFGTLFQVHQMF